jgi:hypothetical protein
VIRIRKANQLRVWPGARSSCCGFSASSCPTTRLIATRTRRARCAWNGTAVKGRSGRVKDLDITESLPRRRSGLFNLRGRWEWFRHGTDRSIASCQDSASALLWRVRIPAHRAEAAQCRAADRDGEPGAAQAPVNSSATFSPRSSALPTPLPTRSRPEAGHP